MPPDEVPDVYRLPAALVRHRPSRGRPEAGCHKLPRRRPPPRSLGCEVPFLTRNHVFSGVQLQPEQLAWASLDHRELLRMEVLAAIWIQERSRCTGRQDTPSAVK